MSGITLKEMDDTLVPTPAADKFTLFFDSADSEPKYKDDTGTVTPLVGAPGQGVPAGGTMGQVLAKASGADYDTDWVNAAVDRTTVTSLSIAAGVVNVDYALGDYFTLALTANVTSITFSNLPGSGKGASLAIRLQQDGTGSRTIALPASFKAITGSDTAVQSAANAYTVLMITTFDNGTRWEYSMKEGAA